MKDVLRKMGAEGGSTYGDDAGDISCGRYAGCVCERSGRRELCADATLQYDISSMIPNRMNWIFTQEQSRCVETELIGEPLPCSIFFTDFFNDGRDFLPMYFARGITPAHCI